jgi:Family of unknown function (DUF5695)
MVRSIIVCWLVLLPFLMYAQGVPPARETAAPVWKNELFTVEPTGYGISRISNTQDTLGTNYIRKGKVFGEVIIRYRDPAGRLDSVSAREANALLKGEAGQPGTVKPLRLSEAFHLEGKRLVWTITLRNTGTQLLTIEDLALPLAYNSGGGENPAEIFEQRVVKHHFISGNNSFLFWERPTGVGPYLLMLPMPGTSLEYFSTNFPREERGVFQAFIHSAYTGGAETRGSWRQPFTALPLRAGAQHTYAFVFRWAASYDGIRDLLVEEGGIDTRVMPGMTVPDDLDAEIALRTRQPITAIRAEFPGSTVITALPQRRPGNQQQGSLARGQQQGASTGSRQDARNHLYKIKFTRLGENRLTIEYGHHYKTYLEFFVTEPLETLYKKRAAFIVDHQQHKDSTKWYDGLFSIYDMKHGVLRGPDNADYFDTSRLAYVLACDDPALCKAPFVAAKNVVFPDQHEIDAVEYYIRHFVWGGLQRTDKETPNPYGVYGTPNWKVNRDSVLRSANTNDRNKDKMHIWRSYDYPHILMLYYHMYQIAKLYPGRTHYLDARGYLERAKETAKAYFTYPYAILPWYETYKWGCYNELLLVDLMADLNKEGFHQDAEWLRGEWEKKVKYFLYDDRYPFRSEYAIDATAFESTHALAKYALLNTMQPDSNLWFDKNLHRWYSHPVIRKEDAVRFMDRQLAANIALRGSLETAYYYLGSDFRGRSDNFTLSYMSQMGGWSILDYALHFTDRPADYIRLGYAAYLSSFALINSGTAASNYGFWYPGKENDGASGWAFESQQYASTWIGKPQGRGPWYYDGEIDLGFGGATRTAATVVTDDPIFGRVVYGGKWSADRGRLVISPCDGLRVRLFCRLDSLSFDLLLQRDGFTRDRSVTIDPSGRLLSFVVENRAGDTHELPIELKGLEGRYRIEADNNPVQTISFSKDSTTFTITLKAGAPTTVRLHKI